MYKLAHNVANNEIRGNPKTSLKQHSYKLPQLVLVLSSNAYSALGRILILKDTFLNFVYL